MCVILRIFPGATVDHDKLYNAAANNWHSWGIVIKKPNPKKKGKSILEIIRKVPKGAELDEKHPDAGGTHDDIEEIEGILNANIDYPRYVHFRHRTKGAVNMDNCHPFELRNKNGCIVLAMHNGNFSTFGNQGYMHRGAGFQGPGTVTTNPEESDTKEFFENYIIEPLNEWANGNYTDEMFQRYVWRPRYSDKGNQSKVLFISTDWDDLEVGKWESFVDNERVEQFRASNDTYFNRVTRGPLFTKLEVERKAKEDFEKTQQGKQETNQANTSLVRTGGNIQLTPYEFGLFQTDPVVVRGLKDIFETFGEGIDRGEISDLYLCTLAEFEAVVETLTKTNKRMTMAAFIHRVIEGHKDIEDALKTSLGKYKKLFDEYTLLKSQVPAQPLLKVIEGERNVG